MGAGFRSLVLQRIRTHTFAALTVVLAWARSFRDPVILSGVLPQPHWLRSRFVPPTWRGQSLRPYWSQRPEPLQRVARRP
jgi:hypothetical protein